MWKTGRQRRAALGSGRQGARDCRALSKRVKSWAPRMLTETKWHPLLPTSPVTADGRTVGGSPPHESPKVVRH